MTSQWSHVSQSPPSPPLRDIVTDDSNDDDSNDDDNNDDENYIYILVTSTSVVYDAHEGD